MATPRPCRGVFSCLRTGSTSKRRIEPRHDGATRRSTTSARGQWPSSRQPTSLDEIVAWERAFLGPKGELTALPARSRLPPSRRATDAGRAANALKTELTAACERSPRRARGRRISSSVSATDADRRHLARPSAAHRRRASGLADDRRAERDLRPARVPDRLRSGSRDRRTTTSTCSTFPAITRRATSGTRFIVDAARRDRAAHPHLADAGAGHGADRRRRCA